MIISGGLIGWITNYLAIKLLFRPYKRIFYLQGLVPKRRNEIIKNISLSIEKNLFNFEDIKSIIEKSNLIEEIYSSVSYKLRENKLFSLLPNKLTDKINEYMKKVLLNHKDEILQGIVTSIESKLDIKSVIEKKLENFSNEDLEKLILNATKKELRHIEILGGILGCIIGIIQFLISKLMN